MNLLLAAIQFYIIVLSIPFLVASGIYAAHQRHQQRKHRRNESLPLAAGATRVAQDPVCCAVVPTGNDANPAAPR